MKEKKIKCTRCGSKNCFEQLVFEVENYLCSACGFTSMDKLIPEASYTKGVEAKNPRIVNELRFYDKKRNIYWYPSVINTVNGMIYPEGNKENWEWKVAKTVSLTEEEKKQYPLPGNIDDFYEYRLAVENAKSFHKDDFFEALRELGAVADGPEVG